MKYLVLLVLCVAGCKQGQGDRCQITADCQAPLVCNTADGTCQAIASSNIDATVPDAPTDAATDAAIDAPVDAPADAPVD